MLRHRFSHDIVYKALLKLNTLYYVYAYLKDTYQLEYEAQEIYDEIIRQSEQILDIAKQYDMKCNQISGYIGDASLHIRIGYGTKKILLDDMVINSLKKLSDTVYIEKDIISNLCNNWSDLSKFFTDIDVVLQKQ